MNFIAFIPGLIAGGIDIYNAYKRGEEQEELTKAYQRKLERIEEHAKQLEMQKENLQRLQEDAEAKLNYLEQQRIREEKAKLEKEQQELEKQRQLVQELKSNQNEQTTELIIKIVENFKKNEEKILGDMIEIPIFLSEFKENNLSKLFTELYNTEKIEAIINENLLTLLKKNYNNYKLTKMNFVVLGAAGVGKSTLINAIFQEYLAKESKGEEGTLCTKLYTSEKYPYICLYDTRGTKYKDNNLDDIKNNTLRLIDANLEQNDPNNHIHCILYCVTNNRFFKEELEVIQELRNKYGKGRLPLVIVYTRPTRKDEVVSVRDAIQKYLGDEKLGEGVFDINFLEVFAKEEVVYVKSIDDRELKFLHVCRGLSTLMKKLSEKGQASYKIAIENSLIKMTKNSFISQVEDAFSRMKLSLGEYKEYLEDGDFIKTFSDVIADVFYGLCDFQNLKEQNRKNIDKNIIKKTILKQTFNRFLFESDDGNKIEQGDDFLELNDNLKDNENLKEYKCTYCLNIPNKPILKCPSCSSYSCSPCFNCVFEMCCEQGVEFNCMKCSGKNLFQELSKDEEQLFDAVLDIEKKNHIQKYAEFAEQNDKITQKAEKNEELFPIEKLNENQFFFISNKLSGASNTKIKKEVETFRSKIAETLNDKIEDYSKEEANKIFNTNLENLYDRIKYEGNMNININSILPDRNTFIKETQVKLQNILKESAIDLSLKKQAKLILDEIILAYRNFIVKKIDEIFEKIEQSNDTLKIFDEIGLNNKEKLEIMDLFEKHCKMFKEIEEESICRAKQYEEDNKDDGCSSSSPSPSAY